MNRLVLVVVSGLPGVGKSTLAAPLARRIEAVVLSRDAAREELGGPGLLSPAATRSGGGHRPGLQAKATERLEALAADHLDAGRSVVVELVADRNDRRRMSLLATRHRADLRSIEVICTDTEEFARRLRARPGDWQRVVADLAKGYEPASNPLTLDSREAVASMVERAATFVLSRPDDPAIRTLI